MFLIYGAVAIFPERAFLHENRYYPFFSNGNTAFVERLNLAFSGYLATLARRTIGRAKSEAGLIRQAQLWQAYYNLCLPHSALRLQLPEPVPTRGSGSPKKWQHCTPAMVVGLTNQVWTVQQLLLFRIPPWRQEVAG